MVENFLQLNEVDPEKPVFLFLLSFISYHHKEN